MGSKYAWKMTALAEADIDGVLLLYYRTPFK